MIHGRLESIEQTTPRSTTFWFKPERSLQFEAGQYLEVIVPHESADMRGTRRWMSLVNAPEESRLGVLTMFPEPSSSYKRALRVLRLGDEVGFGEPIGDFVLPKSPQTPLAFVIGGVGIAPVRSIIRSLQMRGEQRNIQLIYSAPTPQELAYKNVFEDYPLNFSPIITQKSSDWAGAVGHLTAPRVLQLLGPTAGKLIYLCGPQSLIEPLFNDLIANGLPRAQLILDYFPGY